MSEQLSGPPVPSGKTAVLFTAATGIILAVAFFTTRNTHSHGSSGHDNTVFDDDPLAKSCNCSKNNKVVHGWTVRGRSNK